ncbi:hypothetical protein LCGC14_1844850 [marine sediment metagenome]|uniref:Uncharacterized protein n=1 Tax=marine sediment metagenome TaxID=412755 RepID=A0A0F9IRQ2_9ZZZZ
MTQVCPNCAEIVDGDKQEETADSVRYSFDCDEGCHCEFEVIFRAEDAVITVSPREVEA